ncbi:MAG: HypC/HybG/HupF family hydrogenase formation chaperone [Roseiflexaceae bacterium]
MSAPDIGRVGSPWPPAPGAEHLSPVVAGHCCITCSDEALEVSVVSVDQGAGQALVALGDTTEQVDISLIDGVAPGDLLLVHGGVALERLAEL